MIAAPSLAHADRQVRGTVLDAKTAAPIAGAEVSADGIEVKSRDDGTFVVGGVPAGGFDVFVIAEGYEPFLGRGHVNDVLTIRLARDESGAELIRIEGSLPVVTEPATS